MLENKSFSILQFPGQGSLPTVSSVGGLNTSGNDGGVSSDCSEDEGSPGGGGGGGGHMPVVYPWMKKIHVAGAGETLFPPRNRRIESIELCD